MYIYICIYMYRFIYIYLNPYTFTYMYFFRRPESMYDFASILIWLIAVVTVTIGATLSAEEDREHQQKGNHLLTYVYECICVYICMYIY
jgi:hypothetical protein